MAILDYGSLAKIAGGGPMDLFSALGTQFGVPECLMEMGATAFNMLPSNILNTLTNQIQLGKDNANQEFKSAMEELYIDTGLYHFDSSLGRFVFVDNSSGMGSEAGFLDSLKAMQHLSFALELGSQA